ncbi:MAG: hypothetical protein Q7S12_03600 [bacterium]|nr:hypothetical protein [bacterium]
MKILNFFGSALRSIIFVFTGKGANVLGWDDLKLETPSDEEIFEIARATCPLCGVSSDDEAEEIGYHSVFEKKAFECRKCGTLFLGSTEATILRDYDRNTIVPIQ